MVKQELDILDNKAVVYKLIGPVLVKQDLDDAKSTVKSRITHFRSSLYGSHYTTHVTHVIPHCMLLHICTMIRSYSEQRQ
jgi:hypothetical protein